MIGLINQRRPGSACSRKSSLIRVYTNCLSIATFTYLSRKASKCKSIRRCRHCERVRVCGKGGGQLSKTKKNQPAHVILVLMASMHKIYKRPCWRIQRSLGSIFWSDLLSTALPCVCEHLSLRCSPI